jgi:hypothetical protein
MYTVIINKKIFNELMNNLKQYTFVKWGNGSEPSCIEYKQDMLLLHLDEDFKKTLTYTDKLNLNYFNNQLINETILLSPQEFLKKAIELYKKEQQDQQEEKKYTINEIINIIQNYKKKV